MTANVDALVHKVSDLERVSGLMSVFQSLSREEQVALLEWARSICIKLAGVIEKRSLTEGGRTESVVLPTPKPFVDLALRVGAMRALTTGNEDLLDGCKKAYRQILGDSKYKALEEFEKVVLLTLHLAKW